jgi:cell wall-associated NlpC family hydrolase
MRAAISACLVALSISLFGCSPSVGASRSLPPTSLVARAWQGREPPTTQRAAAVVWFAQWQIGKRYCWGGTGPGCFDCSGLVQQAWGSVGVRLPRTSEEIAHDLPEVPLDAVRAGDILWWPGHVGIYAGNGWVIDALGERYGVVRRAAKDPWRAFRPTDEWYGWAGQRLARN